MRKFSTIIVSASATAASGPTTWSTTGRLMNAELAHDMPIPAIAAASSGWPRAQRAQATPAPKRATSDPAA